MFKELTNHLNNNIFIITERKRNLSRSLNYSELLILNYVFCIIKLGLYKI